MKNLSLTIYILLSLLVNTFAQSDHEQDSLKFVTSYTITKQQIQTLSFEGTIDRKKALSAILGKTKQFKVFAVRNPDNKGYHFDWQINELNNPIENKTYFFTENDFFEVIQKEKTLNVLEDVNQLDATHDIELIRHLLLPDELLYGLRQQRKQQQPVECTFEEDGEHFKMYNQMADDLLRIVCYNKNTLFPESTDLIKSYPNMSALDITSIRLTNIKINEELPETVLSSDYYFDQDYEVNLLSSTLTASTSPTPIPEAAPAQPTTQVALSRSNVNTLLKTKLETGKGWETTIGKFHDKSFLLVDFWSASSTPCMEDLPIVQSIHRDFRKKGLRVFGVNCQDYNQKKTVVKKLKQKGITFTSLFGQDTNLEKWGVQADVPTYLLLDEDGKIILQGSSEVLKEVRDYLDGVN